MSNVNFIELKKVKNFNDHNEFEKLKRKENFLIIFQKYLTVEKFRKMKTNEFPYIIYKYIYFLIKVRIFFN